MRAEVKGVEEGWVSLTNDDAMLTGDIMDAGVVCVNKPAEMRILHNLL